MPEDTPTQGTEVPAENPTPSPKQAAPAVTPATPEEPSVSHKAYASLQTKLNQRNQEFADLTATFATQQEANTQLESQLQSRLEQITTLTQAVSERDTALTPLKQSQMRIDAFRSLITDESEGALQLSPEAALRLFGMLDQVPVGEDLESTAKNIRQLAEFGQAVAQDVLKRASAGETPGFGGEKNASQLPTTMEEWAKRMEGKSPTDPQYKDLWAEYRSFVFSNNT